MPPPSQPAEAVFSHPKAGWTLLNTHPWNAYTGPFLWVYWFPKTQISAGVDVGSEDQLKHTGFSYTRRWREEGGGSGRKKACTLLPPRPSASPPLPVRQGAGREVCSGFSHRFGRAWEELETAPKGPDPQRVFGRIVYQVWRASMGGMLKWKSNRMKAHLITATNSQVLSKLPMQSTRKRGV